MTVPNNNQFSERVRQVTASLAVSNLLVDQAADPTKLYEENILLIESSTNLTRTEIKEQFQQFLHSCPTGIFQKLRLEQILCLVLP